MAGITYDQTPAALALNGGELIYAYQQNSNTGLYGQGPTGPTPWTGVTLTPAQIAAFVAAAYKLPSSGYVSMRQLLAALAYQASLVTVFEALPSDITNPYNIAYNHAYIITQSDPFVTGFLQPTLGLTGPQLAALFALATTFPV